VTHREGRRMDFEPRFHVLFLWFIVNVVQAVREARHRRRRSR
jgi:hypothetical protein